MTTVKTAFTKEVLWSAYRSIPANSRVNCYGPYVQLGNLWNKYFYDVEYGAILIKQVNETKLDFEK